MITQERLEEMTRIAEAATPGPWAPYFNGPAPSIVCANDPPIVNWPGFDNSERPIGEHQANAIHIAAASPDVVLDLLAIATAAHAWRTARLRWLNNNSLDNFNAYANAKTDLMAALDGARGGSSNA